MPEDRTFVPVRTIRAALQAAFAVPLIVALVPVPANRTEARAAVEQAKNRMSASKSRGRTCERHGLALYKRAGTPECS